VLASVLASLLAAVPSARRILSGSVVTGISSSASAASSSALPARVSEQIPT